MSNTFFYLEMSIELELNISELYKVFYLNFKEDSEFWWKLYIEEINHASILKMGRDFLKSNDLPKNLIIDNIEDISYINNKILSYIDYFKTNKLDRNIAFRMSLDVESSVAELHFDNFMKQQTNNKIITIFKKLNGYDLDHYNRIKKYIKDNNINV
ncbi:MAG: hypothetical protein WDA02_03115 [Saccharofermentanales bacterium]